MTAFLTERRRGLRSGPRLPVFLAGGIWLAIAGTPQAAVAQSPCDAAAERNATGVHGYAKRGDRCEGIYATDVSAQTMWVAGFTQGAASFDASTFQTVELDWGPKAAKQVARASLTDGIVHLRARGVKPGLNYGMDTRKAAGDQAYEWSPDMLAARGLGPDDIGVAGWVSDTVGGSERKLYVPLKVRQRGSEDQVDETTAYQLVVVPNVRFTEVYVSLARTDSVGVRPETDFIRERQPLQQQPYATQRPITIRIAPPGEPGVYFVEITAEQADGRVFTMDPVWFYHSED